MRHLQMLSPISRYACAIARKASIMMLLVLGLISTGCGGAESGDSTSPRGAKVEMPANEQAAALKRTSDDVVASEDGSRSFPGGSVYALGSAWMNEDGARTRLSELAGRPVVLSMIFTSCSYACPMIVHDMKQLGAALPKDLQDEVQYVLVSIDPDRDTPGALQEFARAHGLDGERWDLLQGSEEDVRTLAAVLGIRYRRQADGQFAHTSRITVLNRSGEIVHHYSGTDAVEDDATLQEVLAVLQ